MRRTVSANVVLIILEQVFETLRKLQRKWKIIYLKSCVLSGLHLLFRSNQSAAASILSIHNLAHQKRLMSSMRSAIVADQFPQWVLNYIEKNYGKERNLPQWAANALETVGVPVGKFVGDHMKDKVEKSSRHDIKSAKAISE